MKINNKLESIEAINNLGLNKFPEQLFKKGEQRKVKELMEVYQIDIPFIYIRRNQELYHYQGETPKEETPKIKKKPQ